MPFVKSIAAGYVLFCVPKENQKSTRYFRGAGGDGLRLPASASCLGRHSHPAGRGPNSSSLFLPQAAVVAVANYGLLALNDPKADGLHTKNPNRCARGFFVLRRFIVAARRNVRATARFHADANAPAWSQRRQNAVSRCDLSHEKVTPKSPRLRSNESPSGAFKRQNGLALARWRGFAPTSSAVVSELQI